MKLVVIAAASAAALVLWGCGVAPKTVGDAETVTETVNGQKMRVDLAAGASKGLAIWFHGQGGDANTRMNEAWLNGLRLGGWAVASADFHGNAWGDPAAVQDVAALAKWAQDKAGQRATLYIAGSMGGLTSLNAMEQGGNVPDCWYGVMPVVDENTVSDVLDATAQIQLAYGGRVPAASIPARNLNTLPSVKYRILSSPDDTWVPVKANADVLATGLKGAGRDVSTLATTGQHGDPSNFNESDLLAFADSCR
ncbi:hypothetical protein AB4068_15120 [Arthrobacter sp. 2RAF22]|uniref:hypothetical protein n=1 Tax=Arthrobacter sp. 2RAF22 TaxID=3232996 RepID=UPI003F8EDBED